MKTKEEILDSMISNIKDTAGQIIYTVRIRELKPFIMDAMQQCADQQSEAMAVELLEWIADNTILTQSESKENPINLWGYYDRNNKYGKYTAEQILEVAKEEIIK